jgi:hypothetical protein
MPPPCAEGEWDISKDGEWGMSNDGERGMSNNGDLAMVSEDVSRWRWLDFDSSIFFSVFLWCLAEGTGEVMPHPNLLPSIGTNQTYFFLKKKWIYKQHY